jgi:NADH dehydrogenase
MTEQHRVVIVGGGFGGLQVARALKRAPVQITLIDRRNFHLFQPLLYQVATGGLSPANIAAPLRAILRRQRNVTVLLGEVTGFDVGLRRVLLADGEVPYDTLVVAAGARHHYFGNEQWERLAPGLKTIEDATAIRRRVLLAFEAAERETDPDRVREWLTFVVVGGGPTGVELAGAIGEIAHHTLRHDFRHIDPAQACVLLVEGTDRVLPAYPPPLSARAARSLEQLGVTVLTGARVTDIRPGSVALERDTGTERVAARTVLWMAGMQGSPLGQALSDSAGAPLDRAGRVIVEPNLTIPGHPEIFVIGDMAHFAQEDGSGSGPLPGVAPVAIQQGKYVARLIQRRLHGASGRDGGTAEAFRYRDLGSMATIGRAAAVANLRGIWLSGLLGWLAWLFVHLMSLVQFHNRVLVLFQWAWNYFTRNRSARLITGDPAQSSLEMIPDSAIWNDVALEPGFTDGEWHDAVHVHRAPTPHR